MTPEGKIKAKVNKALKPFIEDGTCWKFMPVQMGLGAPALDYLLCFYGDFVAIETKKSGGKVTARQRLTMDAIENAGGRVYVIDSDETLDAFLMDFT